MTEKHISLYLSTTKGRNRRFGKNANEKCKVFDKPAVVKINEKVRNMIFMPCFHALIRLIFSHIDRKFNFSVSEIENFSSGHFLF